METKTINFKKAEISVATKDEMKESAQELGFTILKDATAAYKKFKEKTGTVTDRELKTFMYDYLQDNYKQAPGIGCSITLTSAAVNTRERPYKVENVKNEGKRKWSTVREIVGASGRVYAQVDTTKAAALQKAKDLFKEGAIKENVTIMATKVAVTVKGEDGKTANSAVEAKIAYTPSKSSHNGNYIIFGIAHE